LKQKSFQHKEILKQKRVVLFLKQKLQRVFVLKSFLLINEVNYPVFANTQLRITCNVAVKVRYRSGLFFLSWLSFNFGEAVLKNVSESERHFDRLISIFLWTAYFYIFYSANKRTRLERTRLERTRLRIFQPIKF
jgi:hypothetical protein